MSDLKNLLKQINNGKTSFAPADSSSLEDFQLTVQLLAEAEQQGYIGEVATRHENYSGKRFVSKVLIKEALTDSGLALIQ